MRRKSREIRIGDVLIGGNNPIAVQSMVNLVSYDDIREQCCRLQSLGCDIIRMTVPNSEAADVLRRLKACRDIKMPIVADIHFDWRMAIEAARAGADKIRINPGNIGSRENVGKVAKECLSRDIPIRVGSNGGSLSKDKLDENGNVTPSAIAEAAMENVFLLREFGFENTVVAVKSSNVAYMIKANEIIAEKTDLPLHLGVTEAGGGRMGIIKNSCGIGGLLARGIGDTIRVSLTDKPEDEITAGTDILKSVGRYGKPYINIVSCPTCGRTKINLIKTAAEVEKAISNIAVKRNITVAVMGCVVNGPGEASGADIGIAGGDGEALFFSHGKPLYKIPEDKITEVIVSEIIKLNNEE